MFKPIAIGVAVGAALTAAVKLSGNALEKALDRQFCDLTGGKEKK